MTSEWKTISLSDAGVQLIDCVHNTPKEANDHFLYVAIPQMKSGNIDTADARRITERDYERWTQKACPQPWDVVLSRRCNPGVTAHVPEGLKFALGQNLVLLRSNGEHIYPQFLRWLARSPLWWNEVNTYLNVGAVFDSLRCADIPSFKLPIPPLPEQKAIAHILGTLDDKIELNRKMNETLEAMAQALFKSWFVDFDPVIDNAMLAGKPLPEDLEAKATVRQEQLEATYGSLDAAASHFASQPSDFHHLFPDSFELTEELGWMPAGWKASHIGKEVNCVGGATPSTKISEYWDEGNIYWTTPKDLSDQTSKVLFSTARKITEEGLKKISSGLMPVDTVLMSSRAPVGYLALAKVPVAINQGYIAMKCEKTLSPEYVIQWADSIMDDIKQRAGGTTFAEISKKNFRSIPALVPCVEILKLYSTICKGYYDKITENLLQSHSLEKIRDSLLPKLLSGEIRIPEAEVMVEGVG